MWHVKEGERVNYGDDLLDLRVDEGLSMRLASARGLENHVRALIQAQEALANLKDDDVVAEKENPEDHYDKGRVNWFLRISASDSGKVLRLYARPGEKRQVGDLLALFTTEADEPIEGAEATGPLASVFRTVLTPIPLWQGE
jgi:multidrug efflux pump subunit AcrA (membrane-fusion protein)